MLYLVTERPSCPNMVLMLAAATLAWFLVSLSAKIRLLICSWSWFCRKASFVCGTLVILCWLSYLVNCMNEFVFRVVKPHLYFILAVCDCFFEVFQDYFCIIYTNIKHDVQSGLPVRSQLELEFFKESDVSKWLNLNIYFREFTWCLGHKYGAEQFTLGNSLVPSGEKNWTVWSAAWILHKKRH